MNYKVCYLFALLSTAESYFLSIEQVNTELNTFAENLILENYNNSIYTGIFHDNEALNALNIPKYFGGLHIPVIIHDLITPEVRYDTPHIRIQRDREPPTRNNIIVLKNSKDLRSMLEVAKSIPYFSARTNVLVIFTEKIKFTERWILHVFTELWKIYILNVGLIFSDDRINLFTYIPWTSPFEIKNLTDDGISANIFYDKLKNLRKYPVKILHRTSNMKMIAVNENNSTTYLGLDGMTMSTILERHNATSILTIVETDFSFPCRFIHYNYTVEGFFGADVKNESIDICPYSLRLPTAMKMPTELDTVHFDIDVIFDSRPLRFDMDYRVDSSRFQQRDDYCIMIPAREKIPGALEILRPLDVNIWIAIALILLLQVVIYFTLRNFNGTKENGIFHTCLTLYRIQVNNPPSGSWIPTASEKVYLFCWISYCFLISVAYQSNLVSSITVPFNIPPINRLSELNKIDLPIRAYANVLADMHNSIDIETAEIILKKIVFTVWRIDNQFDTKRGYLISKSTARYITQQKDLLDRDGVSLFHIMDECPIPVFTTYQMPRGSPLLEIINKFTPRKIESGLVEIWAKQAIHHLNGRITNHSEFNEIHIKLSTAHLQGAFYILLLGHILATSAFFCEYYTKQTGKFM